MRFVGGVSVESDLPLEELAKVVGRALSLHFEKDDSGRYEECPAYVSDFLGSEIALIGSEPDEAGEGVGLLVRTFVSDPGESFEVDLSAHIVHLLKKSGVDCGILPWSSD